jgi:nucleotide-binding universal stress UspA family protein
LERAMKNILLLIHEDDGQEARLQAALDVTRSVGGHLTCLAVVVAPPVGGDDVGLSNAAELLDLERAREGANEARIKARLAREDVAWNWVAPDDFLQAAIKDASDLADLIVVSSEFPELPLLDARRLAGGVALKSRRPVLAVPARARGLDAAGAVLVAWDGSGPASATLTAATPLLRLSSLVTLFAVEDGTAGAAIEEAATYLARHSIRCDVVTDHASRREVSALILERAADGGYAYVVAGAYSKPPLLEVLFGGVTRDLLRSCPIPLFLVH